MEFGVYTFGDLVPDPRTGRIPSARERMRQMIDMATLADEAGLDIVGVGEHHGAGFVNSATAVTLAAMAQATKHVRLTSSVTILGSADPVRTFQEFATVDLISNGRVELIVGRGAFTESFPLFGHAMSDYDALFVEKLGLFAKLNANERVTWEGRFRPALRDAEIAPRPVNGSLPVWIGAGSIGSVDRAARLGYPLAIPVLGGHFEGYAQLAQRYRQMRAIHGHPLKESRVCLFAHLHVTETEAETRDDFFASYSAYLSPIFKRPLLRSDYEAMVGRGGSLIAGSVQQVIDKLSMLMELTGATRFVGQIDVGGQSTAEITRGIELFATRIIPVLRDS